MGEVPRIAAGIIKELAKTQGFLPGIYLVNHTFGRDLKKNMHFHLSTTIGGLDLHNKGQYKKGAYFYHDTIKRIWRYSIINFFRKKYKSGTLKLPSSLKDIKTYTAFNRLLNNEYSKKWIVHLNKQSDDFKNNVEYLGKYLKRPPIGEARIKKYDGKEVTYEYHDHYTGEIATMTLSVFDFIARLISHIPDENFRSIRYYGYLANAVRGKLLPLVYSLLGNVKSLLGKVYTSWRALIKKSFGCDPLKCSVCGTTMLLSKVIYPDYGPLRFWYRNLVNGEYKPI
jgi:hypothetical protein